MIFGDLLAPDLDNSDVRLFTSADRPAPETDPLVELVSAVNMAGLDASEGALLLHAGGVCLPDGSTAVLCGPSGSGKTTLTASLTAAGLAYVTDETVRMDPATLAVTPFRKPLSVKLGSQRLLEHLAPDERFDDSPWLVPPQSLGGPSLPSGRLEPRLLLFPTYRDDGDGALRPMAPGLAAYLLGKNSSRLAQVSGGALTCLTRVVRRVPAYEISYADTHTVAELLVRALESA